MIYLTAVIIGIVAGLRAFTAPAAVSWAVRLGWLPPGGGWASFMGYAWTPWVFSVLALIEFVTDQLPATPSRTVPMQFGARLVSGAFCGAVVASGTGSWIIGLVAGAFGAAIGTYGGAMTRAHLAQTFGRDLPAGVLEDVVAIALALVILRTV